MDKENTSTNWTKNVFLPGLALILFLCWILLSVMGGIFGGKPEGIMIPVSGACLASSIAIAISYDYNPWKSKTISRKIQRRSVLLIFFLVMIFSIVSIHTDRQHWIVSVTPAAFLLSYNAAQYS